MSHSWQASNENDLAQFSSMMSRFSQQERTEYLKRSLLQDLRFLEMPERHERIVAAHRKTFRWIFETAAGSTVKWTNFVDWLQNDDQLYWITGKAGSGKSTLMKYIYGHPRTMRLLSTRDKSLPIVTAGFFFWNSGTGIQMSQQGLLQTLLYESLNRCDDLIQAVFPQRWSSYEMFGQDYRPWSEKELLQGFKRLVQQDGTAARFCFFVDGLDEFDGDPTILINLFKEVVSTSNVKVCLSSRPWLVFEDAFQHNSNMMLQDLTYPDIWSFISSELGPNKQFLVLKKRKASYAEKLIADIAKKADGLFLWVKLVTTSLLAGLTNSDRISDLQRRLDLIPPDLEDLYGKILSSFDPFYLEHASQLFQLVRASYRPISLLALSFADEEDHMYAIEAEVRQLTDEEKWIRCEETRRRLNSRCKGLLEVPMSEVWKPATTAKRTSPQLDKGKNPVTREAAPQGLESTSFGTTFGTHSQAMKQTVYEFHEKMSLEECGLRTEEGYQASCVVSSDADLSDAPSEEDPDPYNSGTDDMEETLLHVDVEKLGNLKVEYLHRTVKDFLEKDEIWRQLLGATSDSFNPHVSLCRANLLLLKAEDPLKISDDAFWGYIVDCLNYVARVEGTTNLPQTLLIDELNRVAEILDSKGVDAAKEAGILHTLVDSVEPVPQGIWSRVKQEKVAFLDVSWHEYYHTTAGSRNYTEKSVNHHEDSRRSTERNEKRGVSESLADLEGEARSVVISRDASQIRGRAETTADLLPTRSTSPLPSRPPSRSRSRSVEPENSSIPQEIYVPARWRTPRKISKDFQTHWPGTHPDVEPSCTFNCFVSLFGLPEYLKIKVNAGDVNFQERGRRPFLDYLVVRDTKGFVTSQADKRVAPPNVDLIKASLEHGADPNQKYGKATPWQSLLKEALAASRAFEGSWVVQDRSVVMGRWADVVELFLKHGADPLELQNSETANAIRDIFWEGDMMRTKKLEKIAKQARQNLTFGKRWSKN